MSDLNVNRRQFVKASAATIALVVLGQSDELQAAPPPPPTGPADVGTLADYPHDGISDRVLKSEQLIIVRNGDRIYAMSNRCTHKGTPVRIKDGKIRCPAHGSVFSEYGTPVSGPAKFALTRYAISLNDQKHLIVDRSQSFREKDWDKPGAFVSTKQAS